MWSILWNCQRSAAAGLGRFGFASSDSSAAVGELPFFTVDMLTRSRLHGKQERSVTTVPAHKSCCDWTRVTCAPDQQRQRGGGDLLIEVTLLSSQNWDFRIDFKTSFILLQRGFKTWALGFDWTPIFGFMLSIIWYEGQILFITWEKSVILTLQKRGFPECLRGGLPAPSRNRHLRMVTVYAALL